MGEGWLHFYTNVQRAFLIEGNNPNSIEEPENDISGILSIDFLLWYEIKV